MEPGHENRFFARLQPVPNFQILFLNFQKRRQEFDDCGVGLTVNRGCSDSESYCPIVEAGDTIFRCPGLDIQP